MDSIENLYFSLGELAYAVAMADGEIQHEEKRMLHEIVTEEIQNHNAEADFDISEIIFKILDKDHPSADTAYEWAIKGVKENISHLDTTFENLYLKVITKVASATPPITKDEQAYIDRFQKDLERIKTKR